MDAIKYLSQVKTKAIALKELELQLAEIRDRAIGQGSPDIAKLNIMTSLPKDAMAEAIAEYADLLDVYYNRKRDYVRTRSRAVRFLKTYTYCDLHYNLLYLRFIECKTYGEIGKMYGINYKKAQSETRWATRVLVRTCEAIDTL